MEGRGARQGGHPERETDEFAMPAEFAEWRNRFGGLLLLSFTEAGQNAVFMGGPGTGKTHLATAIGVAGITGQSKRVRFYSTVELVNLLEQEKAQGKAGRLALTLLNMDLVIIDELGYLPRDKPKVEGAVLLVERWSTGLSFRGMP